MWLIVSILASGGVVSAFWLIAAIATRLIGLIRGQETGWIGRTMRHAATMTVACALCAMAVHFGMTRTKGLAKQMPASLLCLDVGKAWYGGIALHTLSDRAVQHTLSFASAASITDALLDSDWWLNETQRQIFDASREPERWLTIQMEQARLSDEQLARWLNLVPPPMFLANADTRESPSSIKITAVFGREWQRIDKVPYRIDHLQITAIRLNGQPQEFTIEEGANSNAEIGWHANRVEFEVRGLAAPPGGSPRCEIEIIYRLDLEPSSYENIGPLSWKTTLLVN